MRCRPAETRAALLCSWSWNWRRLAARRRGRRRLITAAAFPAPPFPDRSLAEHVELPPLRDCKLYVCLTNGIEALPALQAHGLPHRCVAPDYRTPPQHRPLPPMTVNLPLLTADDPALSSFVRIQSTLCEQQQFEKMMNFLDADLLLHLALGRCCIVIDYGSRNKKRGAPRALWMGLEFVRFALMRLWLDRPATAYLRGHSVGDAFERTLQGFSKSSKKRLRYFRRFLPPGGLHEVLLVGAYSATDNDDDDAFYQHTLWSALLLGPAAASPQLHDQPASTAAAAPAPTLATAGPAARGAAPAAVREPRAAATLPGAGLSQREREALLLGSCREAVHRLLGLSLFLGGVSHAVLQRQGYQSGSDAGGNSGGEDGGGSSDERGTCTGGRDGSSTEECGAAAERR